MFKKTSGIGWLFASCLFWLLSWQAASTQASFQQDFGAQPKLIDSQEFIAQYGHNNGWRVEGANNLGADTFRLQKKWSISVGEGRGQVVGDQETVYLTVGSSQRDEKSGETKTVTEVIALDLSSGKKNWVSSKIESRLRGNQQTFGGAQASPRATPLVVGDRIFVLDFAGRLICLDRGNGNVIWQRDLCEDVKAKPVQFGFSSSPIADDDQPSQVLVFAAGKRGGLLNLDAATGKINWVSPVPTFSYATPADANFGGVPQWVIVSEDGVAGVRKLDGLKLWEHEFAEKGLTNVPTPLVVSESELVISGQGVRGVRKLEIGRKGHEWSANEIWFQPRMQFFYTNWLQLDKSTLIGCTEKYLGAIDLRNGDAIGKFRGFGEGNIIRLGNELLVLDGRGEVSQIKSLKDGKGLEVTARFQAVEGRCWTPPTLIGDRLLVRHDEKLTCLGMVFSDVDTGLENQMQVSRLLSFSRSEEDKVDAADPVEIIFEAFETKGQQAALELYTKFRSQRKLSADQRIALARAAEQQGLIDLAEMILGHAAEDLPESDKIREAIKKFK